MTSRGAPAKFELIPGPSSVGCPGWTTLHIPTHPLGISSQDTLGCSRYFGLHSLDDHFPPSMGREFQGEYKCQDLFLGDVRYVPSSSDMDYPLGC